MLTFTSSEGDVSYQLTAGVTAVIPEPITLGLVGLAVAGLGNYVRRRHRCA